MSARAFGLGSAREHVCAYCGKERGQNWDHVIPRSMVKSYNRSAPIEAPSIPAEWLALVAACHTCNVRKAARRLVPMSWRDRVAAMNRFFGGTPWRCWDGDPMAAAFREVHT